MSVGKAPGMHGAGVPPSTQGSTMLSRRRFSAAGLRERAGGGGGRGIFSGGTFSVWTQFSANGRGGSS